MKSNMYVLDSTDSDFDNKLEETKKKIVSSGEVIVSMVNEGGKVIIATVDHKCCGGTCIENKTKKNILKG